VRLWLYRKDGSGSISEQGDEKTCGRCGHTGQDGKEGGAFFVPSCERGS
jgi:hypothetical protein